MGVEEKGSYQEDIMTVIAMTREMGTLGKDVALGLSAQMDLAVVHHELVEHEVAGQMNLQESDVHRFLEGNATLFERWKIDEKRLSQYTAVEILQIAKKGNVLIRGWGAAHLLKNVKHVIRVRVCAPMAFRIKTMMERMGIVDEAVARREIERNDAAHTRVMRNLFSANWENPLNYHLVLNIGCIPVNACIDQVRLLAENPVFKETTNSRAELADKVIEMRVRAVLDGDIAPGLYGRNIDAKVASGIVTLSGAVVNGSQIKDAVEQVRHVDGVRGVENEITRIDPLYAG